MHLLFASLLILVCFMFQEEILDETDEYIDVHKK